MARNAEFPEIVAVDRKAKVALFDDDEVRPFASMYDEFGDETDDGTAAVSAIVKIHETCWLTIDLTAFETSEDRVTRH